ncbi:hypothetical protein GCM10011506_28000 [Marivirga lumbricoides]|uniref:Fibronectin type-III domain-containing protein n=1 Tax=Marivirga lumbricoides TaxID=1046115 RepID=A0ABQ1MHE2_9BACT|nr:hypothetical protein GCM10011506_28000 [Marivirga lumbricoides]
MGETQVNTTDYYSYELEWKYNGAIVSPPANGTHSWTLYGGNSVTSGVNYNVIKWNGSGSLLYEYNAGGVYYYSIIEIGVNSCAETPNLSFSIDQNECAPRKLSYQGSPPNGVKWYWQTSSSGTNTSNFSNSINITSEGTYFVRPYNVGLSCWGITTRSFTVNNVYAPPSNPTEPTASEDVCGSKALFHENPPDGIIWYWQGTNPNGKSMSNSEVGLAQESGTYYLRAYNPSTGCWSIGSSSIVVEIIDVAEPNEPIVSTNTCGPKTLEKEGVPQNGEKWYWQGKNANGTDYTSNDAKNANYEVTETGTYYLRSRSQEGCWGKATGKYVEVYIPSAPEAPTVISFDNVTQSSFTAIWNEVLYANSYNVLISENEEFATILASKEVLSTNVTFTNLQPGKTYYCRVKAYKDCISSNSNLESSITLVPPAPLAQNPSNINSTYFEVNWDESLGAEEYFFDIATDPNFNNFVYQNIITTANDGFSGDPLGSITVYDNINLYQNSYYYRIRAANSNGTSNNSETIKVFQFPVPPIANQPNFIDYNSFIATWADENNFENQEYIIQLSTSKTFNNIISQVITASDEYNFNNLSSGFDYYYRVATKNSTSISEFSNVVKVLTSTNYNFIKEKIIKKSGITDESEINGLLNHENLTRTEYYDGFHRPILKVFEHFNPNFFDRVQLTKYDDFGRVSKSYLPFLSNNSENIFHQTESQQLSFYKSLENNVATTDYPYSEISYEPSPLNRPVAQYAPGEDWAKEQGNVPVTTDYLISTTADNVKRFTIDNGQLTKSTPYGNGAFEKLLVTDENGNQSATFTDAFGKTLLKRNYGEGSDQFDTYYIYDIYDNLRFVIQPEAARQITGTSGTVDSNLLKQFAFQYHYDGRNRMIWKKVPGAEPVIMIYDDRDRLVLTQDGEQKKVNKFSFTKYDALNRPIMTGEKVITTPVATIRNNLTGTGWTSDPYETTGGNLFSYTNNSYPSVSEADIYTVTYYDNYDFRSAAEMDDSDYDYSANGVANEFAQNNLVKGQVTGSLTRVLGTEEMLGSINYYDERYRLVQNISQQPGAKLISTNNGYDFVGNLIARKEGGINELQPVIWSGMVGVFANDDNQLVKNTETSWDNAGAHSQGYLEPNEDGYVRFLEDVGFTSTNRKMIGLSTDNTTQNYKDITYALQIASDGKVKIWHNGSNVYISESGYTRGDYFEIGRYNGKIYFEQNGRLLYEITADASEKLRVDASIYHSQAFISQVKSTFSERDDNKKLIISENFTYDHADRLMEMYHEVSKPVKWESLTGLDTDYNQDLVHTGNEGYENSGAYSLQKLEVSKNGFFRVTIEAVDRYLIGLNDNPVNTGYTDMDYAIYVAGNGQLYIYENGGRKTNAGLAYYQIGDHVSIVKIGDRIHYQHNGQIFFTSTKTVVTDLFPDVTTYYVGGKISNATVSNTGSQLMVSNEYNELGELITKNLHATTSSIGGTQGGHNFAQSVDYRYNIRGWLERINHADLSADNANEATDLFGMELGYTDNFGMAAAPQYNGNIAAVKWGSKRNDMTETETVLQNAYGYAYDRLNRITEANYFEGPGHTPSQKYQLRINEYDYNGNIKQLERRDITGNRMDNLQYQYWSSNQVQWVKDYSTNEAGFRDGNPSGIDYSYDDNGNMISDKNKEISTISYNYLNLPEEVTFDNGNQIRYIYDASGIKHRQEVYEGNALIKATDYIGSLIVENDVLQFIQTAEGRIVPQEVDGEEKNEYQYHLKDHLGNVRTTFAVRDDEYATDFETASNPYFDNYDQVTKLASALKRSGNTSHRLAGGSNETVGLMKSLYVSKGDKVKAEVYGKYIAATNQDDAINTGALITALVNMLSGGAVTGEGNVVSDNLTSSYTSAAIADNSNEQSPRAYLNYIMLDKHFNYLNSGFDRLSTSAEDPGDGSGTHQKLSFEEILIDQDGYLIVFLSNESQQTVEVFWDDFRVDHHHNAVLQADDYYPFGLTFNSYQRSYSKANNFKYNGIENIPDFDLNINMYTFRTYDPALGRWWQIDPLYKHFESPYATVTNNPIRYMDLLGLDTLRTTDAGFDWKNVKNDDVVIDQHVMAEVQVNGTNQRSSSWLTSFFPYQTVVHRDPNSSYGPDPDVKSFDPNKTTISIDLSALDFILFLLNKSNPFKISNSKRKKDATDSRSTGKTSNDIKPKDPSIKGIKALQEAMSESNESQKGASPYDTVSAKTRLGNTWDNNLKRVDSVKLNGEFIKLIQTPINVYGQIIGSPSDLK